MNEIITTGLMKEGSLSAKIYFLLLDKPKTQTEISKTIYFGKVQLANIRKNMKDLEIAGYISEVGRNAGKGENYNKIYYQSTLNPFLEFIKKQVNYRKNTSKSKRKENLNKEEKEFLKVFLTSGWFKRFYSQEYLNVDLECEGKRNNRICSCPIRFFARLLEEIFVITETLGKYNINFNNNVLIKDFDKYVRESKIKIGYETRETIRKIVKNSKRNLGNYPSTNKTIDFYFKEFGVLFLPFELSRKLSSLGRIPLTVCIAFNNAIKEELN